jgi:hypothetical protein
MEADAKLHPPAGHHDGLRFKAHLYFVTAEDDGEGEEEGVAHGHDLGAAVDGDAVANEAEVTALDGVEVCSVAGGIVVTERDDALDGAGADRVGEDESEGSGGCEVSV